MSTKFTPGPWPLFHAETDEEKANCALIADAPAMYSLLQRIFEDHDNDIRTATRHEIEALLARHQS